MKGSSKAITIVAVITLFAVPTLAANGREGQQRLRKRDASCATPPRQVANDTAPQQRCPCCGRADFGNGQGRGQGRQAQGPRCPRGRGAGMGWRRAQLNGNVPQDPEPAAAPADQPSADVQRGPTTRPGMAPGRGMGPGRGPAAAGSGQGRGRGTGAGRGVATGGGMPQVMRLIHNLLDNHLKIRRDVREIPGGVLTTTTSDEANVTATIRAHVRQMQDRVEQGQPVRMWDPLFVELFRHHDQIRTQVEDVEGGVKVTQTSDDPDVTRLIRQHATRGVSEFVADGWDRVHEPTPLPAGYPAQPD